MSTQKYDPVSMIQETNDRVSNIENKLNTLSQATFSENDIADQTHKTRCQQLNYQNNLADKFVPYQVCPKCNGSGYQLNNAFGYGTSPATIECGVCGGAKVIPMHKIEIQTVDKELVIKNFIDAISQQTDVPPEFRKIVNDHFEELL